MVYELTRAQQWLYQRLRAQGALTALVADRIYEAPAPQGATLPYVIIDHRAGVDTNTNTARVGTQLVFAIEIVTETQANLALEPMYDAIDLALESVVGGTYRGIIIDRVHRDGNYADWGVESGKTRKHIGALWRLFIRPNIVL